MSAAIGRTPVPAAPPVAVEVTGRLTIHHASDVHTRLGAALDTAAQEPDGTSLVLSLDEVTQVDTAGLQLLLWATREAHVRGVPLVVIPSPAVDELLSVAGIVPADLGWGGA